MKGISKHSMPMFAYKLPGKQVGVSLIELMIASVIGLVLLSGVVTIFSSNNASTTMSAGMARVQENGGVALDIMSYGVRMSGFQGCLGESKVDIDLLANPSPTINFPDNAIWGSKIAASGSWNPARHVDLEKIATENMQLKPNTDVLYIQYGSANTAGLAANMTDSNADIVLERPMYFELPTLASNPVQESLPFSMVPMAMNSQT